MSNTKELKCNCCGGDLFVSIAYDLNDKEAEKYSYLHNDYCCCVALTCYNCGEYYPIVRTNHDADVSEIKGLYDLNKLENRRLARHQRELEAIRLCFSDEDPKQWNPMFMYTENEVRFPF